METLDDVLEDIRDIIQIIGRSARRSKKQKKIKRGLQVIISNPISIESASKRRDNLLDKLGIDARIGIEVARSDRHIKPDFIIG